MFRDIVDEGDKSILFSTHITSDLDKCADIILFIREGRIVLEQPKDELLDTHALIKGGEDDLTDSLKSRVVSYKSNRFGFTALILRNKLLPSDNVASEKPTLDDIMVYYNHKEQIQC